MLDILTFLLYILTFLVKDGNYEKQKKKLFTFNKKNQNIFFPFLLFKSVVNLI